MLRNYFAIALRNLLKRKAYSTINVIGLSIGVSAVILIMLFLQDELSYDKFHEHSEDIYRIAWFSGDPQTRTPHPMALAMVRDLPEVVAGTSLSPLWGPGLTRRIFALKNPEDDVWFEETAILSVDSTFFEVFSFPLLKGNPESVLRDVGGLLISESMAEKYFGEDDPIGKQLAVDNEDLLVQVEGVFEDIPENSHFHFDFLVSYVTTKAYGDPESLYYTWNDFGHFNYIKLVHGSSPKELQAKIIPWITKYLNWDDATIQRLTTVNDRFELQPIEDIHLKSSIRWELEPNGNIGYIYIMSAAAAFILLIACFNFMNLSTARSMERSGEVGIRKSVGAYRSQLVVQFLGESILISFIAIIVAGLLVEVALPLFNTISGKFLNLEIGNPSVLLGFLGSALVIGVLAGVYPAIFLSRIKPALILKGRHVGSQSGQMIRKILVTLQFALSMFLIAGAWTVIQQIEYLQNKDLGFEKEEVIVVPLKSQEIQTHFETLQTTLLAIPGVKNVSAASNIPGKQFNQNPLFPTADPDNTIDVSLSFVDYNIFETLGIELIAGRGFSRDRPSDLRNAFVINEAAVVAMGLENPVGTEVTLDADGTFINGEIIGVLKNFNFQSLHQPIRPLSIQLLPVYNHIVIKLETQSLEGTLEAIETSLAEIDNRFPFQYDFLNETLNQLYKKEQRMASVFTGFSILAIFIACLGLGGLAAINFAFRRKEVGIKKILGAPSASLATDLMKEYTIIVLIAVLMAAPFYWIIISQWLNNFNYRIQMNPLSFILSGGMLIMMSWITLSYLTYNTIRTNPSETLREE